MLQARMTANDHRLYNPARDVAHNFREVILQVARMFEREDWPELERIVAMAGCTEQDLQEAIVALCRFVASSTERPHESQEQCMERSGWMAVKPVSRVAVAAALGAVTIGMHFRGARDAHLGGVGPALRYADLVKAGEEFVASMRRTRLGRWWQRCRRRLARVWAALWYPEPEPPEPIVVQVPMRPQNGPPRRRRGEQQAPQEQAQEPIQEPIPQQTPQEGGTP